MRFLVKVLIACLLVGLLLSWFAIDPRTILVDAWGAIGDIAALTADAAGWALPYVLTGAVIVVPIVALASLLRLLKTRRRDENRSGQG